MDKWCVIRGPYTDVVREWLDIQLVATHTDAIGRLIYVPFVVLVLFLISRVSYIDNIPLTMSLLFSDKSTGKFALFRWRRRLPSTVATAPKATHEPQLPWFFTDVI